MAKETPLAQYRRMKSTLEKTLNPSYKWRNKTRQRAIAENCLAIIISLDLNPAIERKEISEAQGLLFKSWLQAFIVKSTKS
jgi:hypothetical protein